MAGLRIFHGMLYLSSWVYGMHAVTEDTELICPKDYLTINLPNNQYDTPKICVKPVATALNFSKAEQACAGEHGTLLTLNIFSQEEAKEVATNLLNLGVDDGWLGMTMEDGKLWWRDEAYEKVYFEASNPSWQWRSNLVYNETQRCSSFVLAGQQTTNLNAHFELSLEQCSTNRTFVCMSRGLIPIPESVDWCEDGWFSSPDETDCLKFLPDSGTFQTAKQRCRQLDSQVVQPKTDITTELVANVLRADERALVVDTYPDLISCFSCDVDGNDNFKCIQQGTTTCELNSVCGSTFTLKTNRDGSWGITTISKMCVSLDKCRQLFQGIVCTETGTEAKTCETCCLNTKCNEQIPESVLAELSPTVDPLPSQDLSCYVCDYSKYIDCQKNARLRVCLGTEICQTRSTLEGGNLMLEKTCEPSYACDSNKKNNEPRCTGDQQFPVCYNCCEQSGCNEGIPENGLTEYLGIEPTTPQYQCYTCEGSSVEDCQAQWTTETCSANSVCGVRWERQNNGAIKLTMGCSTEELCKRDLQLSEFLCNTRSNNPVCGFCCTAALCNDNPPTMEQLMSRQESPDTRKKRQAGGEDKITPVWVGLGYADGKLTWTNGSPLLENHQLYEYLEPGQEDNDMCATLNVVDTKVEWRLKNCKEMFPVVCSKSAKPGMGIILKHPMDILTSSSNFASRISQSSETPYMLKCGAENVHPSKEVIWIKDNHMYVKNGLPPKGLSLEFSRSVVNNLPNPQGTYQCMVWGITPFQRLQSQPATVIFSDYINFIGSIKLRKANKNSLDFAYGNLNTELSEFESEIIEGLAQLTALPMTESHTISIKRYRTGSLVEFYLRYHLEIGSDSRALREMIFLLSPTTGVSGRLSQHEIFLILEDVMLKTALRSMVDRASEPGSVWSSEYSVRSGDIKLYSTVQCPTRETVNTDGNLLQWPRTRVGNLAQTMQICMSDGTGLESAMCEGGVHEAAYWGPATRYTACKPPTKSEVTDELQEISKVPEDEDDAMWMAEELERITARTSALTSTDLIYVSRILKNIVSTNGITTAISRRLLGTMNNLMNVKTEVNEKAQMIDKTQTRTVHAIEHFSNKVDMKDRQDELVITDNIAMGIYTVKRDTKTPPVRGFGTKDRKLSNDSVFGVTSVGDVNLSSSKLVIFFPDEVLNLARNLEENLANIQNLPNVDPPEELVAKDVRLTYFIYGNADLFISPSQLMKQDLYQGTNSEVVSGSISGLYLYNLTEPVIIVFTPLQKNLTDRSYCAYWDFHANDGYGNWSTEGCYSNGTVNGRIICLCNHLTNFAILTDFKQGEGISAKDRTILGFITIIGLCLSTAGLALTILSFILFRKLRKGRSQKVLVNLAVALLCTNVVFLVGIERTENYEGCIVVAALLHYFLLAAFLWMLMEGILQYLKFVKVLDNYVENFMWKATLPSWGLPAVVVAIVAGIDYKLYRGPENYCWLDLQVFYYAFMAPVGAIILTNAILFILVVKGITCDRPKQIRSTQSDRNLAILQCRAGICCFIILGLTWVFGFFAIEDARIVFQYLFCIFNALQGFLIFIFHNIREPAVRRAWIGLCCKGEKDQKYLSSSYGINTDSTGGKTTSSVHKPSVQLDKMPNNVWSTAGSRDSSSKI